MRKVRIAVIVFVIIGAIAAMLIYNRAKVKANVANDVIGAIPVSVTNMMKQTLHDTLALTGTIAANNDVIVMSEAEGKVTAVLAIVGDFKAAGSALVQIDDELNASAGSRANNYDRAKKNSTVINRSIRKTLFPTSKRKPHIRRSNSPSRN